MVRIFQEIFFIWRGGGLSFLSFVHSPSDTQNSFVFSFWIFWKQQPYMNINILVLGSLALVDLRCRTFSQLKTPLPFHILWSMPCNGLETKWNIKTHYVTKYFTTKYPVFLNEELHCDILWYRWNQNYVSLLVNHMYIKQSSSAMEILPVPFALRHILCCTLTGEVLNENHVFGIQ